MKCYSQKFTALLLVLVLMLSLFPYPSVYAAEAGGVQAKMNQILSDYPSGSYFTVNGRACTHDIWHSCTNCSLLNISRAKGKTVPSGQGDAWTCIAFASYVMNQVFGTKLSGNITQVGNGKKDANQASTYQDARIGDLIYFYNAKGKFTHVAVCMGTTSNAIILYECNATGKTAEVSYRTIPYSQVSKNRSGVYTSVYRAKNYDSINGESSAPKATIDNGTYTLTPACAPDTRLDVSGGSYDNYANVQIYNNNGTAAQQWEITNLGNGCYKIISKQSGKALDKYTASSGSGTNVMQYTWRENDPAQQWYFKDAGDGYYYIVPTSNSGLCLDVYAAGSADETNVQVYTANQSQAQKWKLEKVEAQHTHQGPYQWYEATHPHRSYYKCSICGELYTDNSTNYVSSCAACNNNTPTGRWGSWSEWGDSAVSASDNRQVETRQVEDSSAQTEYRYGRYVYFDSRRHECWCEAYMTKLFGSATLEYSDWSTTRYSPGPKDWTCGNCGGNHVGVDHYKNGKPYWHEYFLPDGDYYWEETRTVAATQKTQYRYRDWISD